MSGQLVESEHRVTPLELFFDLVFVFGFPQVTILLAEDVSWGGLGRGVLVLVTLWWAWASYAWLTNAVDTGAGRVLAVMLAASAAMFVAALAVPEAFGGHRFVFGICFLLVMRAFLGLFALGGKTEPDLFRAVGRMARTVVPGAALILAAAFVPSGLRPFVWLVGIGIGYLGPLRLELGGFRVQVAHFAERHGLI